MILNDEGFHTGLSSAGSLYLPHDVNTIPVLFNKAPHGFHLPFDSGQSLINYFFVLGLMKYTLTGYVYKNKY